MSYQLKSGTQLSENELAKLSSACDSGELPGESWSGPVVMGRPTKFGEPMRQVGFRVTESRIIEIELRARELGLKRSDYLRSLVDADLEKAHIA